MDEFTWAERQVKETLERRKKKQLADQKFVAEEDLKRREAPAIWREIRSLTKSRVDAYNKALGEDDILFCDTQRPDIIQIRIKNSPQKPRAYLEPDRLLLHCEGISPTLEYAPEVQNGKVVFVESREGGSTPEEVAERFVAEVIKLVS